MIFDLLYLNRHSYKNEIKKLFYFISFYSYCTEQTSKKFCMTLFTCIQSILIGTFGTRYVMHLVWAANYRCSISEEAGLVCSIMLAWTGACIFFLGFTDILWSTAALPEFIDYMPFRSSILGGISMKIIIVFVAIYTIIFRIISYYQEPFFIHRFAIELILFFVLYVIQLTIALVLLKSADMLLDYLLT